MTAAEDNSSTPVIKIPSQEANHEFVQRTLIERTERYLCLKYKFRYNIITDKVEVSDRETESYEEINDYRFNSLLRELHNHSLIIPEGRLWTLLKSDFAQGYDPLKDYLDKLPEWDGQDYLHELTETVTTTEPELFKKCFIRWFIAMVASVMNPKTINHVILVLVGGQGIGKTTWCLGLVPEELSKYKFTGSINPDDKDTLIHLSECMLINLDELEQLGEKKLGSLKELITKPDIRIRRPYGRTNEKLVRRASFISSVNISDFLTDITGNRRFLCFTVKGINYLHTVDLRQAYAQALHLYKSGEKYWFDKEEIADINRNNEKYMKATLEEELIQKYFTVGTKSNHTHKLSASGVITFIRTKDEHCMLSPSSFIKVGQALKKLGYESYRSNGGKGYYLQEV